MRVTVASAVAVAMKEFSTPPAGQSALLIRQTETTSGCPIVELTFENGDVYNVTITKARTRASNS